MKHSDADWAIPATVFVGFQFVAGMLLAAAIDYGPTPPVVEYLLKAGAFVLVASLLGIFIKSIQLMRDGVPNPTSELIEMARTNRLSLLLGGWGCILVALQIAALTWLKSMLPIAAPFWADPMLAELDRAVFGTDPWRLLYPMPAYAHGLIDVTYALWFPIKAAALLAILSLGASEFKSRALLAYFLIVGIFGVIGQYALSSAGPIFYGLLGYGDAFADLPSSSTTLGLRNYLWAIHLQRDVQFGGGISAMPSIHVAVAAWVALSVTALWRRLAVLGWAFYLLILVGSVYLGWHYVSDGLVGTVAALLSWKLSPLLIRQARSLRLRPAQEAVAALEPADR